MTHQIKSIAIGAALFTLAGVGCSNDPGPLGNVDSLIILQRPARNDGGDIFQYDSYIPGARLLKLSPPTADGTQTTICCSQSADFAKADISAYDISFDAKSIVFSAKLSDSKHYELFLLQLADGGITPLSVDPSSDVLSPIFLPGDKVMFLTNAVVEKGAKQHQDEYERGTTSQLGRINLDGSGLELGPRNLSHRTALSLASDGRVIFTQWDHLGEENSGHLMFVKQDMQDLREGFGKEGSGISNSTLKATEIAPGRFLGIATARTRTLQAGALIDIRLGDVETHNGAVSAPNNQAEARATVKTLTPDVPLDGDPSAESVGRYYDGYALNAKDKPDLLVSWSDGPVESGELSAAGVTANFGVFLFNSARQERHPILDDPDMWDIFPRPLITRSAPNVVASAQDPKLGNAALIGSLDVYDSTLHTFNRDANEIYGVRVMEGFSSEEGFPRMFGTTMHEGHAQLGIAPIAPDHKTWSAKIPANVPVHLQTVDKFGMASFTETVWFSARPGEQRVCGGCHESRTQVTNVTPGVLDTFALGATDMFSTIARPARLNKTPTKVTDFVGMGWDTQVQPAFAACLECHDHNNAAGIQGYKIIDKKTNMEVATWTFNLEPGPLPAGPVSVAAGGGAYSTSYFSMFGPDTEALDKAGLTTSGNFKVYLKPLDARGSIAVQMLNPFEIFPAENTANRAFPGKGHMFDKGRPELAPVDIYRVVLSADMGGQYFARENKPAAP